MFPTLLPLLNAIQVREGDTPTMGFVVPLTRQQISDVYASGERATIRLIEDLYSTIVDFENNYNRYLQQQSQTVHATNARLNVQISKAKLQITDAQDAADIDVATKRAATQYEKSASEQRG